jgi:hypothetical protein
MTLTSTEALLTPYASEMNPKYGVLFRVLGQAEDGSAAVIGFGTK